MNRLQIWLRMPTYALIEWWFHRPSKHVYCPSCLAILKPGPKQEYETLLDHVQDPNEENHPLRDTLVCPTKNCIVNKTGSFFDNYGDIYIGKHWVYEPNSMKPSSAIGSWSWNMYRSLAFQNTRLFRALTFPAGGVLCWFGLHRARYRDKNVGGAFCKHCMKELVLTNPEKQSKVFLPAEKEKVL